MGGVAVSLIAGEYADMDPAAVAAVLSDRELEILRTEVFGPELPPGRVLDSHAHVCGIGSCGSGCQVHPSMKASMWTHPYNSLKLQVFIKAAGIDFATEPDPDSKFIERLAVLARNTGHRFWKDQPKPESMTKDKESSSIPANVEYRVDPKDAKDESESKEFEFEHIRMVLFAFDHWYLPNGERSDEKTTFMVPNAHVYEATQKYSDCFDMAMSVHPYRADALEEIRKWAAKGVKMIKWLPNSMGIDLEHEKCLPVYDLLKELDIVLVTHTGDEHAVDGAALEQGLGNPLKLRAPLEKGVKVIAAHCASEGQGLDPSSSTYVDNFDLFLTLMEKKEYEDYLFADISAMIGRRRAKYIARVIDREEIHSRLLYGSDYPVPAVSAVVSVSVLQSQRLVTAEEAALLEKLKLYNPLLFSLASMRLVRSPISGKRFPASLFMRNSILKS